MAERKAVPVLIGERSSDHVLIEPHPKVVSGRFGAEIYVRCGPWIGHVVGIFVVGELRKFGHDIQSLHDNLKCTAVLKPNEPCLLMNLSNDARGHVHVRGFARQSMDARTILEFEFGMDQLELAHVASALLIADHS
jgi:hypothetical protein